MMLDNQLNFSLAQALTTTAASTNFYDELTGDSDQTTYNTAPPAVFGTGAFGSDFGIGKGAGTPRVVVEVGAALTGGTSLQIQLQGAPRDAGNSGLRSNLVFATYVQTDVILTALLTANTRIASIDWPMRKVGQSNPRFFQLNYNIAGTFGAGNVSADVTLGDDDATTTLQQYPGNFKVAS